MSIELCILASGSSGNCSVLRTPGGIVMIDAGVGPRTAARRLDGTGVSLRDLRAIVLTHLDSDHFRPSWFNHAARCAARIYCSATRVCDLLERFDECDDPRVRELIQPFDASAFEPVDGVTVQPIPLAHDRTGSHGFVIDGDGCRIGFATDLGRVPPILLDCFENLHMLALESNYDPQMQHSSARPQFLKTRIMGGSGHLSNEQALRAIQTILDRCERRRRPLPQHIVLLHRSRECNCPRLMRRLFEQDSRIAPRLTLAEQYQRSNWLRVRATPPLLGEQLLLAWA
jgi:phosphoribosyl 1,2-cyclic phosphodiesterase